LFADKNYANNIFGRFKKCFASKLTKKKYEITTKEKVNLNSKIKGTRIKVSINK